MLVLLAAVILIPLLYLPGFLIARALLGQTQPADRLERTYERVAVGALLNGWLALTLAELGRFSIGLHLFVIAVLCAAAGLVAWRRGALQLPAVPLGIVSLAPGRVTAKVRARHAPHAHAAPPHNLAMKRTVLSAIGYRLSAMFTGTHWLKRHRETLAWLGLGVVFVVLVTQPFEVVLGVRDAGVYANTGFAIAHTGGIVQYDPLVAAIAADQRSPDPALRAAAAQAETNFLGVQNRERFLASRLRAAGFMIHEEDLALGRVVPQFLHLFPAWIGLLAGLFGQQGGLLATGLLGFLGVWSVGMLGRRLAGPGVGLLAALFLALNGVQVWFSRYSTSEANAQFACFAGLYFFAAMHSRQKPGASSQQPAASSQEEGANLMFAQESRRAIQNPKSKIQNPKSLAAFFAGIAFGQIVLIRIDSIFLIIPLLLGYLLTVWLTRRWNAAHWGLFAGLGAMLLQATAHIIFIARGYFFDTGFARLQDQSAIIARLSLPFLTETLRQVYFTTNRSILRDPWRLPLELALLAAIVALLFWLHHDGRLLAWIIGRLKTQGARPTAQDAVQPESPSAFSLQPSAFDWFLRLSALAIVLLAAYAYFIRPQVLDVSTLTALPGCLSLDQIRAPAGVCLRLQGYIGAPVPLPAGMREVYAVPLANFVRLGWYLSPLGIVLGVAGFALWWRRGFDRASWLMLVGGLLATLFWVRQSYGTSDQTYIYILRRYIPQVYPTLTLGMAYALVALGTWIAHLGAQHQSDRQPPTTDHRPSSVVGGPPPVVQNPKSKIAARLIVGALTTALVAFFLLTNRSIYRHVEYGGALDQVGAIAARFNPDDIVLMRGGAPDWGVYRDMPDLVATPLIYAYGVNAFAVKSKEPGKYAGDLARYVQHWQTQGRRVYLLLGPSGGLALPGLHLERIDRLGLQLREFEALTEQKPNNVQDFILDYSLYQAIPSSQSSASASQSASLSAADYAAQIRGFNRPERIDGREVAWTDGDAQLRLAWPSGGRPLQLTLLLAGGRRPAPLGPARACVAYRPEMTFWAEDPRPPVPFADLGCFTLGKTVAPYRVTIDPRGMPVPPTGSLILRITSPTWVPADVPGGPPSNDRRNLGVQFAGLSLED